MSKNTVEKILILILLGSLQIHSYYDIPSCYCHLCCIYIETNSVGFLGCDEYHETVRVCVLLEYTISLMKSSRRKYVILTGYSLSHYHMLSQCIIIYYYILYIYIMWHMFRVSCQCLPDTHTCSVYHTV